MYIGIDLGTSGVKVILLNEQGEVVAAQTEKLTVSRPHPLWSEQDPEQWWQATDRAMKALGDQHSLQDVKALGIAGQMHGATLLDAQQRVLRPAILWNDGRCAQECTLLEARVPQSRVITGNLMMPGFTAPKLLWVQRHEPEIFRQIVVHIDKKHSNQGKQAPRCKHALYPLLLLYNETGQTKRGLFSPSPQFNSLRLLIFHT